MSVQSILGGPDPRRADRHIRLRLAWAGSAPTFIGVRVMSQEWLQHIIVVGSDGEPHQPESPSDVLTVAEYKKRIASLLRAPKTTPPNGVL